MVKEELKWYQLTVDDALKKLGSSRHGLTVNEVKEKLEKYGYNELKFKKPSTIMRFLRQFNNPLIYIL